MGVPNNKISLRGKLYFLSIGLGLFDLLGLGLANYGFDLVKCMKYDRILSNDQKIVYLFGILKLIICRQVGTSLSCKAIQIVFFIAY